VAGVTASGAALVDVAPEAYEPHDVHRGERTYLETNCYTDILVELLHARGLEPLAAMGSLVRLDFEGDQWTFFKPFPGDLERLYGVDVHEMQPYRSLPEQVRTQLADGRTVIVELDAWFLPDTAATTYRNEHVKTSVAVAAIDPEAERLRYFHNAGLYELQGEDYRGVFRLGGGFSADVLPPYTEIVRFDAGVPLAGAELREEARALLAHHLARRPRTNPFDRFGAHLAGELPRLLEGEAADYHAYAFATVRMAGSAFELLASHVDWLLGDEGRVAGAALRRIVDGAKVLSFKLARRRPFDPAPVVAELAAAWQEAMDALERAVPAG
jgi:hypothetical protein